MKTLFKKTIGFLKLKLLLPVIEFLWTLIFHRKIIKKLKEEVLKPMDVRIKELSVVEGQGLTGVMEHPMFKIFRLSLLYTD
jgi:hypothetical protein